MINNNELRRENLKRNLSSEIIGNKNFAKARKLVPVIMMVWVVSYFVNRFAAYQQNLQPYMLISAVMAPIAAFFYSKGNRMIVALCSFVYIAIYSIKLAISIDSIGLEVNFIFWSTIFVIFIHIILMFVMMFNSHIKEYSYKIKEIMSM